MTPMTLRHDVVRVLRRHRLRDEERCIVVDGHPVRELAALERGVERGSQFEVCCAHEQVRQELPGRLCELVTDAAVCVERGWGRQVGLCTTCIVHLMGWMAETLCCRG